MLMLGMWQGSIGAWNLPLTSFQLLAGGGALLICAAILLGLRRRQRVEMESSVVTEELMAYCADCERAGRFATDGFAE